MKKQFFFVFALAAMVIFAACKQEPRPQEDPLPKGIAYANVSLKLPAPAKAKTRTAQDQDYNFAGLMSGYTSIRTLDIYLLTSDGQTLLFSERFLGAPTGQLLFTQDASGNDVVTLAQPFVTTPGDRQMIVIINNPLPLFTTVIPSDWRYAISSALPMSSFAYVDTTAPVFNPPGTSLDVYPDVLPLSGQTGIFTLEAGVAPPDVPTSTSNFQVVDMTRLPSRAILTTSVTTPADVINNEGTTLGTIDNITWAVGQVTNSVYLFQQFSIATPPMVMSWGYSYIPLVNYVVTAPTYYDYSDLQDTTTAVPQDPGAAGRMWLPGKFVLENTHINNAGYYQGNTTYVLVRAIFTPDPSQIADGGALASDGTFYVGATDYRIYSSIAAAQTTGGTYGVGGQQVYTYTGGKVLYYIWLNPDNITQPVNSPVLRNNIYHINIASFKGFGYNWNPLNPDVNNPDPKPGTGVEPPSPPTIDPEGPLSSPDTYMSLEAVVLEWNTHSYDVDL
ncbi:MAG: Mfa1 family fimbria major subunit [Rikenellaceae bacterium]|nr:Mfa1 family fimbria major subunit [Rikenellaceae bacterium]MCL2691876.1 Mfa1 family fimbria major subunit [Rikenellaceae bacterium]